MQKVTVTYDGVDEPIVATHYFNLSESDVSDIIADNPDFLKPSRLKGIVDRSKAAETQEEKVAVQAEMAFFVKGVIVRSHGTRVGNEFFHIPEETLKFTRGLACNAVVQKVLESEETFIEFLKKVMPESIRENFAKPTE